MTADEAQALIQQYQSGYMKKIFYFCLKKTGNAAEAEELASDITLNILSALYRGVTPRQFGGWVWAIARYRYAHWAKEKHYRFSSTVPGDVGDLALVDEREDMEESCLKQERLGLLRRELAFISREYREIIAAYYLDGRKVNEIAAALRLPPGTVMTKLRRARIALKEGMNMAREFGTRSYQPEKLRFSSSGNQPSGLPWRAIQRLIPVNILCAADNNPCTVEELAVELGIALPYMEEEVQALTNAELLKRLENGKYLTNFFILSRECQNELLEAACAFMEETAMALWQCAGQLMKKAAENGGDLSAYAENDAQMFFAFELWNCLEREALPLDVFTRFQRRDGGNWGLIGFERGEECRLPRAGFSNNISRREGFFWSGYQADCWDGKPSNRYFTKKIYAEDSPDNIHLPVLRDVQAGKGEKLLSALPIDIGELLKIHFLYRRPDGALAVNAIVLPYAMYMHEADAILGTAEYQALRAATARHVDAARRIVAKYFHASLRTDFDYSVAMALSVRPILAAYLAENRYYTGDQAQFCALYC